jgi:hypothetical protein
MVLRNIYLSSFTLPKKAHATLPVINVPLFLEWPEEERPLWK